MDASKSTIDHHGHRQVPKLNLKAFPPINVLSAHLTTNEQQDAEDVLTNSGASLTYDINEANIVLGNVSKPRRAKSELQWKGIRVEDIEHVEVPASLPSPENRVRARKCRKLRDEDNGSQQRKVDVIIDDSSTAFETEEEADAGTTSISKSSLPHVFTRVASSPAAQDTPPIFLGSSTDRVKVVKLQWLNDSLSAGKALPLEPYTVYTGRILLPKDPGINHPATVNANRFQPFMDNKSTNTQEETRHKVIERANVDAIPSTNRSRKRDRIKHAADKDFVGKSFSSSTQAASQQSNQQITRPTHLLHQTTSEHDEAANTTLPPMPDWVRENKIYACERATPLTGPNRAFVCLLKEIKLARLLTLDEIGVRAYSSSIASLAAYPYPIQSTREILALPSCDQKIAHLFREYQTSNGKLQAVAEIEADPVLKVLREFYEIWGVGAKTARDFYYDKGWRDLNDIIEHGWRSLSRVQQIGLKYYDEFMLKIPRAEVESIAAIITKHACLVTDERIESIIVGGYRRGKSER